MGRQHQEMDRPGVRQVSKGSGEQGKMEKTGREIIYDAPTTLAVKGEMMMMMMMMMIQHFLWLRRNVRQWPEKETAGTVPPPRDPWVGDVA